PFCLTLYTSPVMGLRDTTALPLPNFLEADAGTGACGAGESTSLKMLDFMRSTMRLGVPTSSAPNKRSWLLSLRRRRVGVLAPLEGVVGRSSSDGVKMDDCW
ncbi:unnamed protein product, partial [Ixodes pacificus]